MIVFKRRCLPASRNPPLAPPAERPASERRSSAPHCDTQPWQQLRNTGRTIPTNNLTNQIWTCPLISASQSSGEAVNLNLSASGPATLPTAPASLNGIDFKFTKEVCWYSPLAIWITIVQEPFNFTADKSGQQPNLTLPPL